MGLQRARVENKNIWFVLKYGAGKQGRVTYFITLNSSTNNIRVTKSRKKKLDM
jgi:hypothetical protein